MEGKCACAVSASHVPEHAAAVVVQGLRHFYGVRNIFVSMLALFLLCLRSSFLALLLLQPLDIPDIQRILATRSTTSAVHFPCHTLNLTLCNLFILSLPVAPSKSPTTRLLLLLLLLLLLSKPNRQQLPS